MSEQIQKLYDAVVLAQGEPVDVSRTAKLFSGGRTKIAKKLVEEAAETALECVANNRDEVVRESVDLLYNWVVVLAEMGIRPSEIWHEMQRREAQLGLAEKLPKADTD